MKRVISFLLSMCIISTLIMGLSGIVVSADEDWTSGLTFTTNDGKVENGKLILDIPTSASESEIVKKSLPGVDANNYYIEWDMSNANPTGRSSVVFYLKNHRYYMIFNSGGMTYQNESGQTVTITYPFGTSTHNIKIVGNETGGELYIDGYYIRDLKIVSYGSNTPVQVHFAAGKGNKVVISNFKTGKPAATSASKSNSGGLPGTVPDPDLKIENVRYDFSDGAQLDDFAQDLNPTGLGGEWSIKNGVLTSSASFSTPGKTSGTEYKRLLRSTGFADDFVFTAKMRYTSSNWTGSFMFFTGNSDYCMIYKNPDNWQIYLDKTRYVIVTALQPANEWMDIRIETSHNSSSGKFYINDKFISDISFIPNSVDYPYGNMFRITNQVNYRVPLSTVEFDEITFTPIYNNLLLEGIKDGDAFLEGTDINIGVDAVNGANPDEVEYYINGIKAGTGSSSDYSFTLTELPPGKYEVLAKSEDTQSISQTFTIERAVKGDIGIQKISSGKYAFTTDLKDRIDQVASVEYFLDSVLIGTSTASPFKVSINNVTNKNHTVTAVYKNANGYKVGETNRIFIPVLGANEASHNFSNEVRYTVSGTSGNAVYDFSNGTHRLCLKHYADRVTYLTDEGEGVYNFGTGEFVVFTNGTFADVYRNGQFVFSFYMPKAESAYKNISQSGLRIQNESITILEERRNYFSVENVTTGTYSCNVFDMPYVYVADFMAKKTDNFNLVINDGHFRTDLTIENGKVYAWYCKNNKTIPEKWYVGDVPDTEGDIAYRLETSAGMSRLLADGRWIATIRSPRSVGGKNISYKIQPGSSLKYISVRDYNETYIYYDDFDNAGGFASKEYWHGDMYTDKDLDMLLQAGKGSEAYGEFIVYAQNAEFSADLTIKEVNAGLWFIIDRGVTKAYTQIGYNATSGEFEAYNYLDGEIEARVAAKGELPIGQKFKMEVKMVQNGAVKNILLYVDGKPVLAFDKTRFMRGTIGIMIKSGSCVVDRVEYRGDARPLRGTNGRGAVSATGSQTAIQQTVGGIDVEDGIEISGGTYVWKTTDYENFTHMSTSLPWRGFNQLQLQDENGEPSSEVLIMRDSNTGAYDEEGRPKKNAYIYYSDDYLRTYKEVAALFPGDGTINVNLMSNRFKQGLSGRMYLPVNHDSRSENEGNTTVFYSDDKGMTWQAGATLKTEEMGHLVQESEVLEMKDGTVRLYTRTELGAVVYYESKDGGETFDLTKMHLTPFLNAACTYNVTRDPYNPDTIYVNWQMDNANLDASNQLPRTLWCLARSTDEGETWEYCGTIHANINPTENNSQNYTMTVLKDYLMFSAWSDDRYVTNKQIGRVILIEKSKIQGTKNFEPMKMLAPHTIERAATLSNSQKDAVFVIHPASGNVIKSGERYTDSAINKHVAADVAAEFSGTKAVVNADGSVSLKLGATIENKFETSSVVMHNGKAYISIAEFAERFNLVSAEKDGVYVIYTSGDWDEVQWTVFQYAVDLLSDEN